MIVESRLFDTFDRCSRRLGLEKTHEPRSISPLGLLYAGIEGGLLTGDPLNAIRAITAEKDVTSSDLAPMSVVGTSDSWRKSSRWPSVASWAAVPTRRRRLWASPVALQPL